MIYGNRMFKYFAVELQQLAYRFFNFFIFNKQVCPNSSTLQKRFVDLLDKL